MSDTRTKQERLIDVIGNTKDKNVMIAVGGNGEDIALKTEVKRIETITPENVSKKEVRRFVAGRVVALSAAAVLLVAGLGYLFGILRIQDRITPYKPAYNASEHSASWKSAKEATGMEWTQLTDAEKTFDLTAVKVDNEAVTREYKIHALWYKFNGKTLILRYDVEYTGWWSISHDMAGLSQLPSIWTFSFRKQADAMNAENYDQDAFRGAVTDVIGIDRNVWELACKIEFDDPCEETELYAIKGYEGVNNYDDPYLLTAKRRIPQISTQALPDDPFLFYTDNNMPEPFADPDVERFGGGLHSGFYDLWQTRFYNLYNIVPYLENTEKVDELYETYRAEQLYDRQMGNVTRYRIGNTWNLYRFMKDLGMTGEQMEAAVKKMDDENRPLVNEGNLSYDVLFDLYTGVFGRENKEEMALTFKSDNAIAVGEYVFSPCWLYYHKVEDYEKAGITATQVELMLERYRALGLNVDAWEAFAKKLNAYVKYYKKTSETRIYQVNEEDQYDITSAEGISILEEHFYGSWKRKPAIETVTFTYAADIFDHAGFHRPLCMGETDDIWYMECMSSGESEVYVIEKSEPTVMYCTALVFYNGYDGKPALNLDAEWVTKYEYEETLVDDQLRSGKISVLGMDKLFSLYGDDFRSFFYEVIESGYRDDFGNYYTVGYDMMTGAPDQYLVERSKNSVTLGIRFFKTDDYQDYLNDVGEEPTEYYFAVTFTLRDNAGWSFSYTNLNDVYADIPVQIYHSSQMERYISEVELKDVQLRGESMMFQSGTLRITDTMGGGQTAETDQLGSGYLAGLDGFYTRTDIRLLNYTLSDGRVLATLWLPSDGSLGGWVIDMFCYDGENLSRLSDSSNGGDFEPRVKDIGDIYVEGDKILINWATDGVNADRIEGTKAYTIGSSGRFIEEVPIP